MLLSELLKDMDAEVLQGSTDVEVSDVIRDSRKDCAGAAFVCICGTKRDAHEYAAEVAAKGAVALIVEKPVEVPAPVTVVKVANTRRALAELSAAFLGHPTRHMTAIGLTGTKGKTTTTFMIKSILEAAGKKVGLVGTNGAVIDGVLYPTLNTTPESDELQHYFKQMLDAGCGHMIMEVSSQGLKMNRVAGIDFDYGLFTNISPDHIGPDEHADFAEYLDCKAKLFTMCDKGFVNLDDPHAEEILKKGTCSFTTFGCGEAAERRAEEIHPLHEGSFMGISFLYHGRQTFPVRVSTPGMFSVYNALAAITLTEEMGVDPAIIQQVLETIKVDGRMELVYASERCSVIVDYAHNGIAAENILETLRQYEPRRLVVVFGCGGNRDPHRRYEMGEVCGRMADLSVVTEDNSRYERVEDIIADIHKGMAPTGGAYIDIPDRRDAIRYSIEHSMPGDVIAIIGKGHENYQEKNGVRTHLLDREEAEKVLKDLGWI